MGKKAIPKWFNDRQRPSRASLVGIKKLLDDTRTQKGVDTHKTQRKNGLEVAYEKPIPNFIFITKPEILI